MKKEDINKRLENGLEAFIKETGLCLTPDERVTLTHTFIEGAKVGLEIGGEILTNNTPHKKD